MKNRPLVIVLLAVAGFIYYNLFFKFRNLLDGEENVSIVEPNRPSFDHIQLERDTVRLALNYRDPFGESEKMLVPQMDNQESLNPPPVKPEPKYVNWSSIQYFGLLKRTNSHRPLGVISVDGYKHQVRVGESIYDGIKIISMNRESVKVRYKGETKEFSR